MAKRMKLIISIALSALFMVAFYIGVFAGSPITAELSKSSISENSAAGSVVGTLTISGSGTIGSVMLKSETDKFALVGSGGSYQLVTNAVFDYETKNSYTLTLTVTDDATTEDKSIVVSIENVDESAPVASDASVSTNEDTALNASVTAVDSDFVQPMTYSVVSGPTKGSLTLKSDGTYTYTPAANYSGSDSFTYKAFDGYFDSNTATVSINVSAVNDAPQNSAAPTATGALHAGNTLTAVSGTWSDVESSIALCTYSYQWQIKTEGGTATDISGELSDQYLIKTADTGKYIRIKQTCSDGTDSADAYSEWALVANAAPVITQGETASMTFLEDGAAQDITFSATDADADDLSWSISANASRGVLSLVGSKITYTPNENENGSDSFVVSVSDGIVSDSVTVNVTITDVNDIPSFTKGAEQSVLEDCGAQTVNAWATSISKGADNESGQTITFTVSNNNNGLFSAQPAVSATGVLTYTPAANANGSATVTVSLKDSGDGTNTSASQTFTITVAAVNDAPSFTKGADVTVNEDSGDYSNAAAWATALSNGPSDESGEALDFIVTNSNNSLFSIQPVINSNGFLSFTPAVNANGSATVTVKLHDDGGTANEGVDTSAVQTFTITVNPINDAPSFTKGVDQSVLEDCGAQTVNAWATSISKGADNESAQTLTFTVSNDNSGLFSAQPAVSATGVLTYTPAANANGTATVTITLSDNGGTANSGADTSASQTFTITVAAVNDKPSFTKGADQTVIEDCGAKSVSAWAKSIIVGPADEAAQTYSFLVTTNNDALFSALPAIDTNGNLTFTPADNAYGSATVYVSLKDSGGGTDTSTEATFSISVTAVNDTPTLTGDASVTTDEDTAYIYSFTVGDVEDAAGSLALTWDTSDTSLLTKAKMVLGGSGADRTLTLTPVADRSGSLSFTITVSDSGGLSVTKTVNLTINAVNDAPVISTIADRTINEDTSSGVIGFAISDVDSVLDGCEVTVSSSNQAVIKDSGITLGGKRRKQNHNTVSRRKLLGRYHDYHNGG